MAPLDLRGLDRLGQHDGTMRARGELGWPDPGLVVVSGLKGAPIAEHFLAFSPAAAINLNPDCALQLVLAGKDELFDIRASIAAYDAFAGTKKNLVVLPDATHYDAYNPRARRGAEARARLVRATAEALELYAWLAKMTAMKRRTANPSPPADEDTLRQRVLGAAFSTFLEKGYARTSMLDIASRAKISKRDLYAMCSGKPAMLREVISERARRMRLPLDMPAVRQSRRAVRHA